MGNYKMELAALCSAALPDSDAVQKVIRNYSELSKIWKCIPPAINGIYNRHLIGKNDSCEVYIIAWGAGADSGYHSHPEIGCWMTVLDGEVYEYSAAGNKKLQVGDCGFRRCGGEEGCHRIIAYEPAFSLHIYAPRALKNASV